MGPLNFILEPSIDPRPVSCPVMVKGCTRSPQEAKALSGRGWPCVIANLLPSLSLEEFVAQVTVGVSSR